MKQDPIQEGLARGWTVLNARELNESRTLDCDVAIIGTGAGGGMVADSLTAAGLKVVMLEEGPLRSSRDFRMRESEAYPDLYQESAARKTADKAINILQGRAVGGSTTVNWTSSFRTPEPTLDHWANRHGLKALTPQALAPWFARAEDRLGIAPWTVAPNPNNEVLRQGAQKLGIEVDTIRRNVKDCWNLGYCGMGCPINAKQSMLITTVPAALDRGATLVHGARVQRLVFKGDRVDELLAVGMDAQGIHPRAVEIRVRARHVVLAAGAINGPALLLRSKSPDPHRLIGKRTFLHPTVISAALMDQEIRGDRGAPQSLYSDHFLHQHPIDGPVGFKLESAPMHPVLFGTTLNGWGASHQALMQSFTRSQVLLALMRDGFHERSAGGTVTLRDDGSPVLDYPLTDVLWDGARRALLAMAEIQFAAGAKEVMPTHEDGPVWRSWREAQAGVAALDCRALRLRVVSAHVMGGCAMGGDERSSVTDDQGRFRGLQNLTVADGSLFPTSIGANPQLSIYGLALRIADRLVQDLGG